MTGNPEFVLRMGVAAVLGSAEGARITRLVISPANGAGRERVSIGLGRPPAR